MGKHKEKEIKTNAMRILEKNKIPYETIQYECEEFIDGLHTKDRSSCRAVFQNPGGTGKK